MTPTWLELHVDDVLLGRDPACWPDAASLVDAIARAVEAEGGRLSIRLRERFARQDRHGLVRDLRRRGHEVGWHAHGRRLREARDAVVAAGGAAGVAAPGLVQAGPAGAQRLLLEARALGARVVTDRLETRPAAYAGWLAREALPGLTMLDVSVSPFAWGVLARRDGRVVPGEPDWTRLTALADVATRMAPPEGGVAFFGATVHEHDLAEPGTLRPRGLDGLRRWVARFRPVPSATLPAPAPWGPSPPLPRGLRVRHALLDLRRRGWPPRDVAAADHVVRARRVGPASPERALVVVHGGGSGLDQGLGFLGLPEDAFPGWAVWTFARSEGVPRAPGHPRHVADTRAVLDAALAEGVPTAVLSWSGGIVPALRAIDARVDALIDAEGPADRFSLVPPGVAGHELASRDPWDDGAWLGMEAVALLPAFRGRYTRLQGRPDHVHGADDTHARRLVAAARDGHLVRFDGPLALSGPAAADAILAATGR